MMPCESHPKAVSISFLAPGTAASGSLRACSRDNSQSSQPISSLECAVKNCLWPARWAATRNEAESRSELRAGRRLTTKLRVCSGSFRVGLSQLWLA